MKEKFFSPLISEVYGESVKITNNPDVKVDLEIFSVFPNNSHSCSIFNNRDYSGTKLNLTVMNKNFSSSVYQSPITFLDRNAKPTPKPAETTATNNEFESLKEQIRVLTAKINKICKSKPKPKGC